MRTGWVSRPWAGLDLGAYSVKLLALQPGVGVPRIAAVECPYPSPNRDSGPDPDAIAQAISRCAERLELPLRSLRGLTLGISGPDVIVKQIQLPLMDEAEVGSALRFEARKHLPFDPQTLVLDYQVLGRYVSERKVEVLLAAVSREHLDRQVALLDRLGLRADIVDAAPLALANAALHEAGNDRTPQLLLDIGHTSSHFTLHQRGEPFFSRRFDFGGRHLTEAIARQLQVPFEEAEEWKLAAGSEEPGFRVEWNGRELQAVRQALEHDLVDEVRRSLAFYGTLGHLPESPRLLVSGATARLPGIAEQLAELLQIPAAVFDPLADLGDSARARIPGGPQFAQALGLALRTS